MAEHSDPSPQPAQPGPAPQRITSTTLGPTLVLGATGSFGGAVAHELIARGEPVRLFVRDQTLARDRFGAGDHVEYVEGDALNGAALTRAADGCSTIVHGVNYPYHLWRPNMVIATENVIGAATAHTMTILFPGNVYGLGPQTDRPLTEEALNQPNSRKGELRVELEAKLREAASESGPRVVVLRAGDYFGPTVRNGLVDPIFGNAARGKAIQTFGNLDKPHQWAYVPDLARAGVDLLTLGDQLEPFEIVHFRGFVETTQQAFLRQVAVAAGYPQLKIQRLPWPLVRLAGVFKAEAKEMLELRHLFDEAVILHDARLRGLLPDFEDTLIEEAIRATIESYR